MHPREIRYSWLVCDSGLAVLVVPWYGVSKKNKSKRKEEEEREELHRHTPRACQLMYPREM
jgi:hypothetical protein